MKLKKLSEDHYIIVSDSEIKIGDIVAERLLIGDYGFFTIHTQNDIDKTTQKVITHSTDPQSLGMGWMQSVQPLLLSEVKELVGETGAEKKYTKEDVRKFFALTLENAPSTESRTRMISDKEYRHYVMDTLFDRLILSLQPTEWEVEFVDGKLKLKQ